MNRRAADKNKPVNSRRAEIGFTVAVWMSIGLLGSIVLFPMLERATGHTKLIGQPLRTIWQTGSSPVATVIDVDAGVACWVAFNQDQAAGISCQSINEHREISE